MQYTVTGADGRVILSTSKREVALNRFYRQLLNDGLPVEGIIRLDNSWVADGRWGAKGARLSRLVVAAGPDGVFDLDGSGVESTIAAGEDMTTIWCVEGLRALEGAA